MQVKNRNSWEILRDHLADDNSTGLNEYLAALSGPATGGLRCGCLRPHPDHDHGHVRIHFVTWNRLADAAIVERDMSSPWQVFGMISTAFHDTFTKDAVRANVANTTNLKREGSATEVADIVAYLASSDSSFPTGVNLDINGGLFYS
jgi:NAD(P)-dependent dehydrogenase (short-subunit alcohol dehydrogenase family)